MLETKTTLVASGFSMVTDITLDHIIKILVFIPSMFLSTPVDRTPVTLLSYRTIDSSLNFTSQTKGRKTASFPVASSNSYFRTFFGKTPLGIWYFCNSSGSGVWTLPCKRLIKREVPSDMLLESDWVHKTKKIMLDAKWMLFTKHAQVVRKAKTKI